MRREEIVEELRRLADGVAGPMGLEIVDIVLRGGGAHRVLRIDIDRPGPLGVALEDCARVSQALSAELDANDLVPGSFTLEVSSPGVDRPIRTADDIRRNTGRRVRIDLSGELLGRRRCRGLLKGLTSSGMLVEDDDGGEIAIPLDLVRSARQDAGF